MKLGMCIAVGIAVGTAIGAAVHQMATGTAFGVRSSKDTAKKKTAAHWPRLRDNFIRRRRMIESQLVICAQHFLRCMYLAGFLALWLAVPPARASILYESATNGGGGGQGPAIFRVQFLASEFTLQSAATITNIIGEVQWTQGANEFFMTLLQLSGPGLPNTLIGDPFGGTSQLYTTTFSGGPTLAATDISFPVSISVSAGTYAVVFGSGLFGSPATAEGFMPCCAISPPNIVLPGANLFVWYDSTGNSDFSRADWFNTLGNRGERFVVEGITIPEPSPGLLIFIGLGALAFRRFIQRPLTVAQIQAGS